MAVLRYLSHPQVQIDPMVPVPDWSLSDQGRARIVAAGAHWLAGTTRIISSAERKARETADLIVAMLGIAPQADAALNEIDRSATGYLPHDRHEALASGWAKNASASAEGWETATSVQRRGIEALHRHVAAQGAGDLLMVGHGGIGTLICCALSGTDLRGRPDQPAGGGCVWTARLPDLAPIHGWRTIERVADAAPRC